MSIFWQDKKVLVAGGAGAIGSYLIEQLIEDGAKISVADNLSRGRLSNFSEINFSKIDFHLCDLRYFDSCINVCRNQDIVMNLAAPVFGVEYSSSHHGEMLTNSLLIGLNLLEAARRVGVKRYLLVSSSCVYSDSATVPTPESEGWSRFPEIVNSGYGWAKRILEMQALFYYQEYGMEIAIGRPFNGYGGREPKEDDNKSHVLPLLIRKFLRGDDTIVVWGSGNQTRSFVHYRDLAKGLKLITELYPYADPVNIGHDQETSLLELLQKISKVTGKNPQIIFDRSKPEGASRKAADTTKFRKITGFVPSVSLTEGLKEYIENQEFLSPSREEEAYWEN
jgi:nucleoside-diphosphate-sugar epimerase